MVRAGIQVSLNGALKAEANPQLDLSLEGLAADAAACARQGAEDFHVHPRTEDGRETLASDVIALWIGALRCRISGGTITVSTGAWIAPLEERLHAIADWTETPDFASVNFHEDGAEEIADALIASGVGVEAGIWHQAGADRFLRYGRRAYCRRLLIEMPDAGALEVVSILSDVFERLRDILPGHDVILHGERQSAWPMRDAARARGMATRIGLEDTLHLPDGPLARSNAELLATAMGLPPPARTSPR